MSNFFEKYEYSLQLSNKDLENENFEKFVLIGRRTIFTKAYISLPVLNSRNRINELIYIFMFNASRMKKQLNE
ncbi:hypothetical protein BpHYR1_031561 [Brachionus plicatilis]|uniref:Uncharacterized protein n=1 Tax=Brachionus plicatilis TaxID=10195 RepID=A0A3M7P7A8_BRAPC|nr:hypothetical protein BpHYR1_031561 [Brachionus plicatilis]